MIDSRLAVASGPGWKEWARELLGIRESFSTLIMVAITEVCVKMRRSVHVFKMVKVTIYI